MNLGKPGTKITRSFPGFTLVELLVVMAILGVLSVGLIVAINPRAQFVKTRDTTRKVAIRQIQDAIERYRLSYGTYPVQTSWLYSNSAGWQTFLGSELKSVPIDPTQNNCASPMGPWGDSSTACFIYAYLSANGSAYDLVAHLENTQDPDRCGLKNWPYVGGGGASWCDGTTFNYSDQVYAPTH